MSAALLNIVGGLGMLGFLALMLLRGTWARAGYNRAIALALMLVSLGCVTQAMALEQYGARSDTMQLVAYGMFGSAVAAAIFWLMRRSR
jgi:hypothetical protein